MGMAASTLFTSESKVTNEEEKQNSKVEIKNLKKNQIEDKTWNKINDKMNDLAKTEKDPIVIGRSLHSFVSKEFGNGWNLIFGTNYFGICSFVNNNYTEFTINDIRFLLFRSLIE